MAAKRSWLNYWSGKLHLWLGLSTGLVVFIVGITGALFVFQEDLKPVLYKDWYFVETTAATKQDLAELRSKAQAALGASHEISGIDVAGDPTRTYIFTARKNNSHGWWYGSFVEYNIKAYVDPYSGKVLKVDNTKKEFFTIVIALHRTLLLNPEVGNEIVGYSILGFVIILVTGIVLWWPKNKFAKQDFTIKWKASFKRLNYDLHRVPGFFIFLFALLIATTGLYWSFDWVRQFAYLTATGSLRKNEKPLLSDSTRKTQTASLTDIYGQVLAQEKEIYSVSISFPKPPHEALGVFVRHNAGTRYNSSNYQFDRYTGKLLKSFPAGEKSAGQKLLAMNYDIHVGALLGWPHKVFHFIVGLVVASLPVTGFLFWLNGKKKNKVRKEKSILQAY